MVQSALIEFIFEKRYFGKINEPFIKSIRCFTFPFIESYKKRYSAMYLDLLGMFSRDVAVFYGPYSLSDLRVIKLKHSKEKVF
jgi:hypothetical protein